MNIEPGDLSVDSSHAAMERVETPVTGLKNACSISDLQYVSIQLNGQTYGGWYRTLPSGQMELLTLANLLHERRPEDTALEQARGMLTDFVRAHRPKGRW